MSVYRTSSTSEARNVASTSPATPRLPLWLKLAVLLGATLLAAGAVIALLKPGMLLSPHDYVNQGVRVYAGYLTSRNAALALMLITALLLDARAALANMMFLIGTIQIFDACIDIVEGRWPLVPGVVIFGVIFLFGASTLAPFRRRQL
jgi:hypothetical protein